MKPTFLVANTTTAHTQVIDTLGNEYPTWLLLPEHLDRVSDELREKFRYQRELVEMASRIVPEHAGLFVDIGAGLGAWTVQLGKMRPRARILAFEPCQPLFLALSANILLNRLWNVRAFELAVDVAPGTVPLFNPVHGDFSSSTTAERKGVPWTAATAVPLSGTALLHEKTLISAVKIHVSGNESAVLAGQSVFFERHGAPIFLELRSGVEEIAMVLDWMGYDLAELCKNHYFSAPRKELRRLLRRAKG